MNTLANYGQLNYTIGGNAATANSNTVYNNVNVSYAATMVKTASPETFVNDSEITYHIRVKNTGTGSISISGLDDNLGTTATLTPLEFVNGSATATIFGDNPTSAVNVPVNEVATANKVTFYLTGTLAHTQSLVVSYRAKVKADLPASETSIDNTANFAGTQGTGTTTPVTATATHSIDRTALTVEKLTSTTADLNPGDALTYTFNVNNYSAAEAVVTRLTDTLPENFTVGNILRVTIGSVSRDYTKGTSFTVSDNNVLTLTPVGADITIPAMTGTTPGLATITIPGTITA